MVLAPLTIHLALLQLPETLRIISHFKWTILSGSCTFNDEIVLINQLPSQAITNADKSVCTTQTQITANPPLVQNENGVGVLKILAMQLFSIQVYSKPRLII